MAALKRITRDQFDLWDACGTFTAMLQGTDRDYQLATGLALSAGEIELLAHDLAFMHVEENHTFKSDCFAEWLRRIGGWRNVFSYAKCMRWEG